MTDAPLDPIFEAGRDADFVRDVGSTLATTVFLVIAGAAQSIIVARTLGPAGKGLVALTFLVPAALCLMTDTGFSASTIYFSTRVDLRTLSTHAYTFIVAASAVGLAVTGLAHATGVLAHIAPGVTGWLLVVACLALPTSVAHDIQNSMLVGLGFIRRMNTMRLLTAGSALGAVIIAVGVLRTGPLGVAVAVLASTWLTTIVESGSLRRIGSRIGFGVDRKTLSSQLRYAASDHVGGVVQYLNYRLDQFMVAGFIGARGLGLYTVAVTMAEMLWLASDAIATVVFPHISRERGVDNRRRTWQLAGAAFALSIVGSLGLLAIGRVVIELMYSDAFSPAYRALVLLLPGACVFGPAKILLSDLAGRGRPGIYSGIATIGLVITVVLDLILVPRWGIRGAATASSAAYIAVSVAALVAFVRVSTPQERSPA